MGREKVAKGVVYGPWGPAQSTQKAIFLLEQVSLAIVWIEIKGGGIFIYK
jgi:hypothetical protein